ncbi:hypothetical protein GWK47_016783 [Chionoecetes opilio]|uniref:Uncharacterized protein n=1 Tax=Chionoecetes opilio TaxID=41210 RepID=A0A8J4XRB2_CHIOP|nr:hypothetical protein GWK47_016783 [Chionoecetes opilio]
MSPSSMILERRQPWHHRQRHGRDGVRRRLLRARGHCSGRRQRPERPKNELKRSIPAWWKVSGGAHGLNKFKARVGPKSNKALPPAHPQGCDPEPNVWSQEAAQQALPSLVRRSLKPLCDTGGGGGDDEAPDLPEYPEAGSSAVQKTLTIPHQQILPSSLPATPPQAPVDRGRKKYQNDRIWRPMPSIRDVAGPAGREDCRGEERDDCFQAFKCSAHTINLLSTVDPPMSPDWTGAQGRSSGSLGPQGPKPCGTCEQVASLGREDEGGHGRQKAEDTWLGPSDSKDTRASRSNLQVMTPVAFASQDAVWTLQPTWEPFSRTHAPEAAPGDRQNSTRYSGNLVEYLLEQDTIAMAFTKDVGGLFARTTY